MDSNTLSQDNLNNISKKNVDVVNSLKNSLIENTNKCIKEIDILKTSMSYYKDSMSDFVNLSLERSDTIAKYSKDNNYSSYNLPGVFANSLGSYDLDSLKKDSQRIIEINKLYDEAENQKESYFKMIVRSQNEIKLYLNAIAKISNDISIVLEQLSQESSWNYNKQIKKI